MFFLIDSCGTKFLICPLIGCSADRRVSRVTAASERVVERRHEQLQLFEGAAVATDLRRLVLHHVAEVLQLLTANLAFMMPGTHRDDQLVIDRIID